MSEGTRYGPVLPHTPVSTPEGRAAQRERERQHGLEVAALVSGARQPWSPADAARWLLAGRDACVDGWGVRSTSGTWDGTLLLNGTRFRVTVTPADADRGEALGG